MSTSSRASATWATRESLDLVARHGRPLVLGVQQRHVAGRLLDQQSRQHAPLGRLHDEAHELLAHDGAGIDDRGQQFVGVLAIGVRQLGPDLVALAEQAMAGAAVFGEQRLAGGRDRRGLPAGRC